MEALDTTVSVVTTSTTSFTPTCITQHVAIRCENRMTTQGSLFTFNHKGDPIR